jgi:hypothetical protein
MTTAKELQDWAATLLPDEVVGIDDGGLTICVVGQTAYLEIGGLPEDE